MPDETPSGLACGRCQRQPPPYDRCFAPFIYARPIDHFITMLKYQHRLHYGRTLGTLLAGHLEVTGAPLPDVLLPVPLHHGRLRERGFNQAIEFARELRHALGIPMDRHRLKRIRPTPSQTGLDRKTRRRNLRGAFEWGDGMPMNHVAVLDDVVTTGSTCAEIARTLKRAGVSEVSVWAVARTPQ